MPWTRLLAQLPTPTMATRILLIASSPATARSNGALDRSVHTSADPQTVQKSGASLTDSPHVVKRCHVNPLVAGLSKTYATAHLGQPRGGLYLAEPRREPRLERSVRMNPLRFRDQQIGRFRVIRVRHAAVNRTHRGPLLLTDEPDTPRPLT